MTQPLESQMIWTAHVEPSTPIYICVTRHYVREGGEWVATGETWHIDDCGSGQVWESTFQAAIHELGKLCPNLSKGLDEITPPIPPWARPIPTVPRVVIAPGVAPTYRSVEGGDRWHYLSESGQPLDPPAYMYQLTSGGWGGGCDHYIFPDGYSPPGPASREHIEHRIETMLYKMGIEVRRDT